MAMKIIKTEPTPIIKEPKTKPLIEPKHKPIFPEKPTKLPLIKGEST